MKKISAMLAAVSFTLTAAAQTNNNAIVPSEPIRQSNFSLGVKGAFGHSFMVPYSNNLFNPSWDAGLTAVISPWAHWGIGIDATYSSEGATFDYADHDVVNRIDYLRVPIKAIYFFRTYEMDFRPKISLGPALGFVVNDPNMVKANSFDLGSTITAGFNYRLVRAVWLNVDASYYQGLIDAYDQTNDNDLNGNVRLNVGVSFGF